MTARLLSALGVDPVQFRALVGAYLKTDWRAAGGATRAGRSGRPGGPAISGLLIVMGIGSIAFGAVAAFTRDPLFAATMLTTYGAANTMMMLLVDFTGVVVSPDDYAVLGHRPVGSRTYFAARLTSVAAYVAATSAALASVPAFTFAFVRGLGVLAMPATIAAVMLCNLVITVFIIAGYVGLVGWVHPARLRRATVYVQLATGMLFYGLYYLATVGFRQSFFDQRGFADMPWMWVNPAAWFAAFVPLSGGAASRSVAVASLAALALALVAVPVGAGRLSLEYARRIGEVGAAAEPPRAGGARRLRVPGFSRGEARAVALLIRAQFRFDTRFRMAVLGVLPLTAFYCMLDPNAFTDPFGGFAKPTGITMYFALMFLPITLHAALQTSESWRAGWIYFACPASPARLVVATKNFVGVYFLGTYLVMLAAVWAWFYERVWHALVHAAFVGLLAHLLLQLAVVVKPALPFASQPRRGERSSGLFLAIVAGGIVSGSLPILMPLVYARPAIAVAVFAVTALATAALEYALRLRVDEAVEQLEFSS